MVGFFVRLAILAAIIYIIYRFSRKTIQKLKGTLFGGAVPMNAAEECPSCGARVRVPKEAPGTCPQCGVQLGRSPEGKLLIRIN